MFCSDNCDKNFCATDFLVDMPPPKVGDDERGVVSGAVLPPVLTTSRASIHSNADNDSSATMSADEGPPLEPPTLVSMATSMQTTRATLANRNESTGKGTISMRDVIHSAIEQNVQEMGSVGKYSLIQHVPEHTFLFLLAHCN